MTGLLPAGHNTLWAQNNTEKAKSLESMKDAIQEEKKRKLFLKEKAKEIENTLLNTKAELVAVASEINQNQIAQTKTEDRIKNLEIEKIGLEQNLHKDRAFIGDLIIALKNLKQTPPQALLVNPQKPIKTAQTALLLREILPAINHHAKNLEKNLQTLNDLSSKLLTEHKTLKKQGAELKDKRILLSKLIEKRQTIFDTTNADIKQREQAIIKISHKAKNLEQLVEKLRLEEKKREAERLAQVPKQTREPKIESKTSFNEKEGRFPVPGTIKTGFNKKDDLGANSNGITFAGLPDALVIAPLSGKVQFTGEFKRYGNIVIIEHDNGYHSLVAGMAKISTSLGASVKSGEPIGTLPNSALNPRPTLYYELRKNGKPVNPDMILKNLKT